MKASGGNNDGARQLNFGTFPVGRTQLNAPSTVGCGRTKPTEGSLTMTNSMRRAGLVALAALTVIVSACSSSGGNPSPSTPAGSGAAGGPPVNAATRKAVVKSFTIFFNSNSTTAQSQAVLQNGAAFHKTLVEQGKSDYAKKTSVKVVSVTKVSRKLVDVKFTITSGSIKFPYQGNAVREGGKWKVAAKTLCGLLKVEGDAPAACRKKSITALPH